MEGEESLLDSILDAENIEDMEDIDMVDVEEGELVENNHHLGETSSVDVNAVTQEPQSKNPRRKSKKRKNKKKKGVPGPNNVTDINRFVIDTCRHLKESKSYLIWTAVGCLGVPALSDLVKEVDAIQACGGQKTADGRRNKTGGGILWSILKVRDPNAFKEVMTKGKEFEKQLFNPRDLRNKPNQKKRTCSEAEGGEGEGEAEGQNGELDMEEKRVQKRPVHERIRVPVSYADIVEVEEPKKEAI